MAELIEPGKAPEGWSVRIECPHCGGLVRLVGADIRARWDQANWGDDPGNWAYSWDCPGCRRTNHVGLRGELLTIPFSVLDEAKGRNQPRRGRSR